ncbi:BspA family leucine-rich repeat surface protein [Xylocopilactobacillus apis]|uniref:Surface protein n=1 Tax=Xylocopilactobacillus apis TaxID=2932183 RepID=A0AAU9D3N5_9LACO|nr:BspA family leucine-rich repeat surface protein [Xylocopilactobacillus apis]BDR55457.1 hypothetical protein KIMC2_00190 [Xylocopilactobacillus apis]
MSKISRKIGFVFVVFIGVLILFLSIRPNNKDKAAYFQTNSLTKNKNTNPIRKLTDVKSIKPKSVEADITAPSTPKVSAPKSSTDNLVFSITSNDNPTDYYAGNSSSNNIKQPVVSGIKGYVYTMDEKPTGTPTVTKDPATGKVTNINLNPGADGVTGSLTLNRNTDYNKYLHTVAVDNNNNVSDVKTVRLGDSLWWSLDSVSKTLTIHQHELNWDTDNFDFVGSYGHDFEWPWYSRADEIEKVVIEPGVTGRGSLYRLFYGLQSLTSIEGMNNLNTTQVTSMSQMFHFCSSLENIDITHMDTTNVTDMSAMFNSCLSLKSLDFSQWNTSSVQDLSSMFWYCQSLTSLDLNNFDTSHVTTLRAMFTLCYGLKDLKINNWDVSQVKTTQDMFVSCRSLVNLDLGQWALENNENAYSMFSGCESLISLDLSHFNTSKVKDMTYMFSWDYKLMSVNISSFDTSNVTNMFGMFLNCKSLTTLDLSNFDTSSIIYRDRNEVDFYSGEQRMLEGTSSLWKLTLGPNSKLNSLYLEVGLKDPVIRTQIIDLESLNNFYFSTHSRWVEVGSGDSHNPAGPNILADSIITDSQTRTDKRTYVWDQSGEQGLIAATGIDLGVHEPAFNNQIFESSPQTLTETDTRSGRLGKTWHIEAAESKPMQLDTDSSTTIAGDPLWFKNSNTGSEINFHTVAQTIYSGTPTINFEDNIVIPWTLGFKAIPKDIPQAGHYTGQITFTLVSDIP